VRLVPLFNNGLLSNELVLSVRDGPGRAGILPPVSRRCCDSKELEINLGYNNFFCGPRPTTRINQISSFRASARAALLPSFPSSSIRCTCICRDATPTFHQYIVLSFFRSNTFREQSIFYAYLTGLKAENIWGFFVIRNRLKSVFLKIIIYLEC